MYKSIAIIIPTYNRKKYLIKNLESLIKYIHEVEAENYISIYVSDNCSSDGTSSAVHKFSKETDVRITIFTQKENIGSIRNFIFLIDNVKADFLMLLGDDDYINAGFLKKVIEYLNSDNDINTIIPNCYNTAYWKYRTPIAKDRLYSYPKSLKVDRLGTQMSGLVFRSEGLSEEIKRKNIHNSYLSVFFVGYSSQKGKTVHILTNPIRITIPEKRPWNYNPDMFFDDFSENLVALNVSYLNRVYYEMYTLTENAVSYISQGLFNLIKIHRAFFDGYNITIVTKILFPLYILMGIAKGAKRRFLFMVSPDKAKYIHRKEQN